MILSLTFPMHALSNESALNYSSLVAISQIFQAQKALLVYSRAWAYTQAVFSKLILKESDHTIFYCHPKNCYRCTYDVPTTFAHRRENDANNFPSYPPSNCTGAYSPLPGRAATTQTGQIFIVGRLNLCTYNFPLCGHVCPHQLLLRAIKNVNAVHCPAYLKIDNLMFILIILQFFQGNRL